MAKPYFFPPRLNILVGLNRSKRNSCTGLEVETPSLDLKEVLFCFVSLADKEDGFSNKYYVILLPNPFLDDFGICFKLTCLSFLCQIHLSSSLDNRHVTFCLLRSIRSISSSNSEEGLVIFCLDYGFVFVEGHNITIVTKLTYAKLVIF